MIFKGFQIHATPFIADAYCECGCTLREVSNGLLGRAMYCTECENVYELKLVKVNHKKVSGEFLEQARKESAKWRK